MSALQQTNLTPTSPLQIYIDTGNVLLELENFARNMKRAIHKVSHNHRFCKDQFGIIIDTIPSAKKDGRFNPYIEKLLELGWEIISADSTQKNLIKFTFSQTLSIQDWSDFVEKYTLKELASVQSYIESKCLEIATMCQDIGNSLPSQGLDICFVSRFSDRLREYETDMLKYARLQELAIKVSKFRMVTTHSVPNLLLDLYSDLKIENEREDRVMPLENTLKTIKWCITCLIEPTNRELPWWGHK